MRKKVLFEGDGKNHIYDSAKATELGTRAFGEFGDPAGYEETLFQTRQGLYFVVGRGGEASPYAEGEDIRPLTADEAESWQA